MRGLGRAVFVAILLLIAGTLNKVSTGGSQPTDTTTDSTRAGGRVARARAGTLVAG